MLNERQSSQPSDLRLSYQYSFAHFVSLSHTKLIGKRIDRGDWTLTCAPLEHWKGAWGDRRQRGAGMERRSIYLGTEKDWECEEIDSVTSDVQVLRGMLSRGVCIDTAKIAEQPRPKPEQM